MCAAVIAVFALIDQDTFHAMRYRNSQQAFTLAELLVVIAILGILAAVAIPNIASFMDEGEEEAGVTELANIQTAVLAGMVAADVSDTVDGTSGVGASNFNSGDEFTIASGYLLSSYVLGGLANVEGDYNIQDDGTVTQLAYPLGS